MRNSFVRSFIVAALFAAAAALFSVNTNAEDNEKAPDRLLYQAVDTTDGGDSSGGGIINPGPGH
jgi:hypothetical protein